VTIAESNRSWSAPSPPTSAATTTTSSATRKSRFRLDDARHFLVTTKETFDAVTSESARPLGQGRGDALHEGVLRAGQAPPEPGASSPSSWQLYQSNEEAVKSEIATFFDAFPNGRDLREHGRQRRLRSRAAGQVEPTHINVDAWQEKLDRPSTASWRRRCAKSVSPRSSNCWAPTPAARRT